MFCLSDLNDVPTYFYDKSKINLWISFRLIQALWTLEAIIPFIFGENNTWPSLKALTVLELVVSVLIFAASFFSCLETKMTVFFSTWSVVCALYHLFLIGIGLNSSGDTLSWHLVSMFVLPLWSSLHRVPVLILWGQQLTTFSLLVSIKLARSRQSELNLELVAMFGVLTILSMAIVYTQQAAGCLFSESVIKYKVDLENVSFMQNSVRKTDEEERDMTLYLSHEIRNPLFNISNALDFFNQCLDSLQSLSNPKELPSTIEAMRSYTADIRVGTEHCTNLLTNILSLKKIEQGKLDWQDQLVNVKRLCQNVVTLTKYMAKEGVELRVDVPPDVWVLCDERLLSQVLVNLVANALKFTSQGFVTVRVLVSENFQIRGWRKSIESSNEVYEPSKRRWLSSSLSSPKNFSNKNNLSPKSYFDIEQHSPPSSRTNQWVTRSLNMIDKKKQKFVFQVCDTGPGIRKEKQGMLFQKFQQAGNHFGAGIGLMLSQKIVQFKGGCIDLVSPAWMDEVSGSKYSGSKFSFTLDLQMVNPNTQLEVLESRKKSYVEAVNCLMDSCGPVGNNKILATLFGMRLLLVDDSMTNLKQLRHKFTNQEPFSQLGWSCELAQTGKAALVMFQRELGLQNNRVIDFEMKAPSGSGGEKDVPQAFSVIVVDSDLSLDIDELKDGREVIRRIREEERTSFFRRGHFQKVLIISYSGYAEHEHQNAALDAGADIVWAKPLPSATKILQDILEKLWCSSNKPEYDCLTNIVQIFCEEKTASEIPVKAGMFQKRAQIICGEDKSMKTMKYSIA